MGIQFKPLSDMILVKPHGPAPRQTKGGLLLPETVTKKANVGTAVAVGPGRPPHGSMTPKPMAVEPGQVVVYDDQALTVVEVDGEELHVVPEGLVLGVLVSRPANYNAMLDPDQYRPRR